MSFPSGFELFALLAVLVLLFGATKLPTAARSIGQSLRIFKAETKGLRSDDDAAAPGGQQAAQPQTAQPPQTAAPQQALPPSGPQVSRPTEQSQRNIDTTR